MEQQTDTAQENLQMANEHATDTTKDTAHTDVNADSTINAHIVILSTTTYANCRRKTHNNHRRHSTHWEHEYESDHRKRSSNSDDSQHKSKKKKESTEN